MGESKLICRNCGCIVTRNNRNRLCAKCYYGYQSEKETVFYDYKVWKKFNIEIAYRLVQKYNIILHGYKTRSEKNQVIAENAKAKLKKIFKRNDKGKRIERRGKLIKVFKKIAKGTTSKSGKKKLSNFSSMLNGNGTTRKNDNKKYDSLMNRGKKTNIDSLMGNSSKKYLGVSSNNYDSLTSKNTKGKYKGLI